ncbi:MAG: hypothetical protein HY254_09300 [Burkholderiales bacterium]|nr:hypothetical protein [Burkholderiales bacterium]
MPKTKQVPVNELDIDLNNFRTIAQENELTAIQAMISISPSKFWGLMESLLDDGYLPTENIIVLEEQKGIKVVKEGNRRIAALKIAFNLIDVTELDLPAGITKKIDALSDEWQNANSSVPCSIYGPKDSELVDKIVTLTHGKAVKAGRDDWSAIARARHNRDANNVVESGLDLLEKYFKNATNLTAQQRTRWSGDYYLTILDEAAPKIASRLGIASSSELAKLYPKIKNKKAVDDIIFAIGMQTFGFKDIRDKADFGIPFGLPPLQQQATNTNSANQTTAQSKNSGQSASASAAPSTAQNATAAVTGNQSSAAAANSANATKGVKVAAAPINDQRSVRRALKQLKLSGQNRAKVATLRIEAGHLTLTDNPIAFCFLLRSMFEISAKAYCDDHASSGLTAKKQDGSDRQLVDVLRDIVNHLTKSKADKAMVRTLHGSMTDLASPNGILSITSLNQLVHNPTFAIRPSDIPTSFANVFPLLEEMNK